MNNNQIIAKWDDMTPRERDAWVAEVVFGWEFRAPDELSTGWYERVNNPPFYDWVHTGCAEDWSTSTDVTAAWTIVEKSAEWGGMEIGCYGKPESKYFVAATHTDSYPYQRQVSVTRSKMPEAVCLAALIAKLSTEGGRQ